MNGTLKTTLSLLILSFCVSFQVYAQCAFTNLIAEAHDCDNQGNFLVDIVFEEISIGSEGFNVKGNGNDYGNFSYGEPFITIGPLDGNGSTVYEFIVTDIEFGCSEFVLLDAPTCFCQISNFTLTPETCGPDSLFNILVEFDHQFMPSDSFRLKDVTLNVGNSIGPIMDGTFVYSDLPISVGPFLKDHLFLPNRVWKIWDSEDTSCEELAEVDFGCNCQFLNVDAQIIDCNDEGEFFVILDFDAANNFANAFTLLQNGDILESFLYTDLPVELGPFTGSSADYELMITDTVEASCKQIIDLPYINCDPINSNCEIYNVIAEVHPCEDDGSFFIDLSFDSQNTGNEGFRIQGNGMNYGDFSYDLPFVTLGPFDSNNTNVLEFVVIDNQFGDCSDHTIIDVPDCDLPCEISNFVIDVGECKTQNSYEITILIEAQNPPNDWVSLNYGGLTLGLFKINDFPISIPNFYDFGENSPLIFANFLDSDCFDFGTFDAPNCEDHPNDCFIGSPFSFSSDCNDDGTFDVTLFFDVENAGNDFFEVFYEGESQGQYPIGQMPFTLDNFQPNNEPFSTITICINDNPDCCRQLVLENSCYGAGCEIWDVIFEPHDCDDEGNYLMDIAFESNHTGILGFTVLGNGQDYGSFNYDEPFITVGPLSGDGSINQFLIIDNQFPDCQSSIDFDPFLCDQNDCEIVHIEVEVGDCNFDGTYNLWVEFEYQNVNNDFFDVYASDDFIGFYSLADMPVHIENFPYSGAQFDNIKVCINDNPDCCKSFDFEAPSCDSNCEISDLQIELEGCNDDDTYNVWVNFNYTNSTSDEFQVIAHNQVLGDFPLNELPLLIDNYPFNGSGHTALTVCIIDGTVDCCDFIEFEEPDCPIGDCSIEEFWVEIGDCNDDGTFPIWIEMEVISPTQDHFDFLYNNEIVGFYSLDDLPIFIPNFDGGDEPTGTFGVCINDNPDCCAADDYTLPNCETDCNIWDLWVEAIECDTIGFFYVELGFEYENIGMEGFSVVGNGVDYGDFEYADLPITIGPLESGGDFVYEFIVLDNLVDDCQAEIGFGPWYCDDDCHINNVTASVSDCNDEGEFFVTLEALYQNVGNEGFKVQGNGTNYGNFGYADLPITLGPFEGDGTTAYEFVVIDLMIDDCQNWTAIDPVECPINDCDIVGLIADPGDCNDDGTYSLWINFEVENPGNDFFDVYAGDDFLGFFQLNDLPVLIPNYPTSGGMVDEITVCINDHPDCCASIMFDALDCILAWPGDANDDNIANNFDLLNIGLAFGKEGSQRSTQGIEWTGLVAENWDQFFENDANFKHADCNGNGLVSDGDIEAIILNYDETHGDVEGYEPPTASEDDPAFFVDLPNAEDIEFGVPFTAPIILGTEMQPLNDIYGIAFTLNFDPDIINPSSIEISYDPSWIGAQPINLIKMDKTKADEGKVEIAISRTDQNNASGFGEIAAFIGIIDNIAGKQDIRIEITQLKAIMNDETIIPLRTPTETIELVTSTKVVDTQLNLTIYPNPTTNEVFIRNNSNQQLESIEIQDVSGRILKRIQNPNKKVSLSQFPAGMYILNVKVGGKNFFERIIKLEKN